MEDKKDWGDITRLTLHRFLFDSLANVVFNALKGERLGQNQEPQRGKEGERRDITTKHMKESLCSLPQIQLQNIILFKKKMVGPSLSWKNVQIS